MSHKLTNSDNILLPMLLDVYQVERYNDIIFLIESVRELELQDCGQQGYRSSDEMINRSSYM